MTQQLERDSTVNTSPSRSQILAWREARKSKRQRSGEPLEQQLMFALRGVPVAARRIWPNTPGVRANISMLRNAWGKSIHDVDPYVYRAVFRVQDAGDDQATPRYVLRPAAAGSGRRNRPAGHGHDPARLGDSA